MESTLISQMWHERGQNSIVMLETKAENPCIVLRNPERPMRIEILQLKTYHWCANWLLFGD